MSATRAQSDVHYLPCDVDFIGSTDINAYFKVSKKSNGLMHSQLRGHALVGERMSLSTGEVSVQGLLATKGTNVGGEGTKLEVTGSFNEMTVWQHDVKPDLQQLRTYIDWFEISNAVQS